MASPLTGSARSRPAGSSSTSVRVPIATDPIPAATPSPRAPIGMRSGTLRYLHRHVRPVFHVRVSPRMRTSTYSPFRHTSEAGSPESEPLSDSVVYGPRKREVTRCRNMRFTSPISVLAPLRAAPRRTTQSSRLTGISAPRVLTRCANQGLGPYSHICWLEIREYRPRLAGTYRPAPIRPDQAALAPPRPGPGLADLRISPHNTHTDTDMCARSHSTTAHHGMPS